MSLLSPSRDPRPCQEVSRDTRLAPCRISDAFARPKRGGVLDEAGLHGTHVGFICDGGKLRVDVTACLQQLQPLDRLDVTRAKLFSDAGTPLLERLSAYAPPWFRTLSLQRLQVVPHCRGLNSSRSDRRFVLI